MKAISIFAAFVVLLAIAGEARAENDQRFVIGLGVGNHRFANSDEFRNEFVNDSKIDSAEMLQFYFEFYPDSNFGIGLRSLGISDTSTPVRTAEGGMLPADATDREISIANTLITGHWIALGSESYARLGFLVGIGRVKYTEKLIETVCTNCLGGLPIPDNSKFERRTLSSRSVTGTARLAGIYLDWGADGFGARLGMHHLVTDLPNLDGLKADGSGISWYLDLRWAFASS